MEARDTSKAKGRRRGAQRGNLVSPREDTREDSNVGDTNKADTRHQHVDGVDRVDEEASHRHNGSSSRSGPQPETDED